MELEKLVALLNEDLSREYQHMLFYTHAATRLRGIERLYLAGKLKEHAASEMQHIFQFGEKIRANGGTPVDGSTSPPLPEWDGTGYGTIFAAIKLEEEVVANYHERHRQASELHAQTGKHYDLVVFLEEQIEHSQGDIDELKLIVG